MARETWSNKLLYISTVAGATIGFGATWRFPYQVGQNGGGAYLLVFIAAMLILGVPMLVAEHVIGRRLQTNTVDAFGSNKDPKKEVNRVWKLVGILAIIGAFGILSYYMVLGGWVISYIADIPLKNIDLSSPISGSAVGEYFSASIQNPWKIMGYTFLFVALNYYILVKGIIKGIERVITYVMPLFLLIVIIMLVRALTLPNAMEGIKFYLIPDFSLINANVFLEALGQVFFALSIGFGVMITLASYLNKKEDMVQISVSAGIINTLIPLAMGFIIFPALASVGVSPESGPSLVFQVLPAVFSTMFAGPFFAVLFFILLLLAALTTSITIYEVIITTLVEKTKLSRSFSTFLTLGLIFILGNIPCILSDSLWKDVTIFGSSIFDTFDSISANYFFTSTALLCCIFIGFVLGKEITVKEITNDGEIHLKLASYLFYYLKFIIPCLIIVLFIMAI